ncbi:MAG: hypothetical protein CSA22_06965 [Deltaproteobacteria bacterium]|nr:MAG: hypothetical protein CSA22_06965 [Deltaproteobacteria bacterium]
MRNTTMKDVRWRAVLIVILMAIFFQTRASSKPVPPHAGYPINYHRVAYIASIDARSILIGDSVYGIDENTQFNLPGMLNVSSSHFKTGDLVGLLFRKDAPKVVSVWRLTKDDAMLYWAEHRSQNTPPDR